MHFAILSLVALISTVNAGDVLGYGASPYATYSGHPISYANPGLTYGNPQLHYANPQLPYASTVATYAAQPPVLTKAIVEEGPAAYDFEYGVHDPHTGDSKSQRESRRGDQVQGQYSVVEPDGTKRIVEYAADGYSGFNAVVRREPPEIVPSHGYAGGIAPVVKAGGYSYPSYSSGHGYY